MTRPWLAICAGAFIGMLAVASAALQPLLVAFLVVALLALIPALVLPSATFYWVGVFLFMLQFDAKKVLGDGRAILQALRLDASPWDFVPTVHASDLVFLVLVVLWINDLWLARTRPWMPGIGWLALGFLGWAVISSLGAASRYLAVVELVRQSTFFLVYLYAANTIDSKRARRWVWVMLLLMVVVQGGTTLFRFTFQYYDPFFGELFGRTAMPDRGADEILLIEPDARGWLRGLRNSFGTVMSGAITSQMLLLGLPAAALACTRNPMFRRRLFAAAAFGLGLAGLVLTFSRSSMIGAAIGLGLCGWFTIRRRYLSTRVALLCVVLAAAVLVALAPKIGDYFTRKLVNVEVRLEQYETGMAMVRAHPFVGVGLNNSVAEARRYGRFSYSLNDPRNRTYETPIHSFYLTLLTEVGVVGCVLYFGFFAGIGWKAWRLTRSEVQTEGAFSALVVLLGLVSLGVGVLTNPLFDHGVLMLVWFLAGMVSSLDRQRVLATAGSRSEGPRTLAPRAGHASRVSHQDA